LVRKPLALAFLLILFVAAVNALSTMRVPAIDADEQGVLTELSVSVVPGTGKISVDISPLISVDTQESIRTAAQVAANLANKSLSSYDLHVSINADASSVDGPSGGAALTLLAYAELTNQRVRRDATVSAAVATDGTLSGVGGVREKMDAALADGIDLMVLSKGQSVGDDFDYVVYAIQRSNGSFQVVEAADAQEAARYLFTPTGSKIEGAPTQGIPPLSVEKITPSLASAPLKTLASEEISILNSSYAAFIDNLTQAGTNLTQVTGNEAAAEAVGRSVQKAGSNAQLLLDNGYYYSAANTAFLAAVMIESLSARNASEEQFGRLLDGLWDEIDSTTFELKTTANFEWVAAAELRYYWAKWKLDSIENSFEEGASVQSLAADYAAAKVWLEAAKRMNELAKTQAGGLEVTELNARNYARRMLDQANALAMEDERIAADNEITWHLQAATQECASAAYVACSTDSKFVLAYAHAMQDAQNKTGRQVMRQLATEEELSGYVDSPWAEAYFIHSLFNVQENNRTGDASYLVTALKLQNLASELKQNNAELLRELEFPMPYEPATSNATPIPSRAPSVTPSASAPVVVVTTSQPLQNPLNLFLALAAVTAAVLLLAFLLSRVTARKTAPRSLEQTLERLDEALVEGRISERTYDRLRAKYSAKRLAEEKKPVRRKLRRR